MSHWESSGPESQAPFLLVADSAVPWWPLLSSIGSMFQFRKPSYSYRAVHIVGRACELPFHSCSGISHFSMWFRAGALSQYSLPPLLPHEHQPSPPGAELCCLLKELHVDQFQFCCQFSSVQFSSVAQSCPTLCDPMNCSTPGFPVLHQLPKFTQTHVHRVGDAIQPSHPLSSPFPSAPNPSQHQSLFQ